MYASHECENETMRRTKVIATVGPASLAPDVIGALVDAGADVLRLNCSHVDTAGLLERIRLVRAVRPEVAILVDIQGPKLRYGGEPRELHDGERVSFTFAELGLPESRTTGDGGLRSGQRILLHDGRLETVIEDISGGWPDGTINVRVLHGGLLQKSKGVNLPDTEVSGSVLSAKDRADLEVAQRENVDYVAVSFVQRPSDLGVELPFQVVPAAQHKIARTALRNGVIAICATEMLESMTTSSRATRAEVADVTGAVRDGFDAVMLSGETAVGVDPVRAVEVMCAICEAAERDVHLPPIFADANPSTAAVTAAASSLARRVGADSLLSLTYTGHSARLLAACRPGSAIIAATPSAETARKLRLLWGVHAVVAERDADVEVAIGAGLAAARDAGMVRRGDKVVVCASRLSLRSDADTIWLHIEP
jgi:pyruvate kinase